MPPRKRTWGRPGLPWCVVDAALLDSALEVTPDILNYARIANAQSMLNTPATFPCYLTGLTLKWIQRSGGLETIHKINQAKAELLYRTIGDSDGFYRNSVQAPFRSINSVPFVLADAALERLFWNGPKTLGSTGIPRSAGSESASITRSHCQLSRH